MLSLRKINPMARAVGTMGIVATMVGAVTFANLTSNTVALTPNDLTTATAQLRIGPNGCGTLGTTFPGLQSTTFSTSQPASVNFCLDNTGGVPLVISAAVTASDPGALNGSAAAQATTLSVTCGTDNLAATLSTGWAGTFPTTLPATGAENCTATATLSPSFNSGGNDVVPTFSVNFTGTEPTPAG